MIANSKITPALVQEHGLTESEYDLLLKIMDREPTIAELGIFSVMWSEHCSYKSSKVWLKTFPTTGPKVLQGPGENAGAVDIGDGLAAVFKIESHNHPSFIEPYQGAATGVGGILRDVFTMGARPIANLNALRFGDPSHPKTRRLVSGVVSGIGGYGNSIGVPTVAGETNFHASYNGNILVNAMTVGLARADRIFLAAARGPGNRVLYVGAKTGRDGIHGATMASAEFTEEAESKRPTVQVGDPFTEKLLLEACLELMAEDAIVAIQDMGAAGLTSSSVEMAARGGLGIDLNLDHVPVRETGMTAYEIMLSESQERMLLVVKPGAEHIVQRIFAKWELDCADIGVVTSTGRLVVSKNGQVEIDIPVAPLVDQAPLYTRPYTASPKLPEIKAAEVTAVAPIAALKQLTGCPDMASKRWIWEQYDHLLGNDTIQTPGGDSAVIRVRDTRKALAMVTDCTPRYCAADPKTGGMQAVVETWRNLSAVGALPLAITDNLNFGNPQRPEIMGQIVGCIEGMAEACRALDYPVISGNVSLYNETNGQAILPTPVVGGVGLIDDYAQTVGIAFAAQGSAIVLLGETRGWLGASLYLREIAGREEGAPPPVDLAGEKKAGDLVRGLIRGGQVQSCHDLSDGGLLCAVAEMALAGDIGATLDAAPGDLPAHAWWFGEDQGRYVVAAASAEAVLAAAKAAGVPAMVIGKTGGSALTLAGGDAISLGELRGIHEEWLPTYMAKTE
jgi:phosphoribosylformylglycinamidine synthase II